MVLDNLNTWKIKLLTNSEDISDIKLPSLLPLCAKFTFDNSNSPCLKHFFYFILIIALALFRFWVRSRGKCSASHFFISYTKNLIFFLLACNTDSNFEIYSQPRRPTQNNQWDFCTVEQKATIILSPWSNFEINLKYSQLLWVIFHLLLHSLDYWKLTEHNP